VGTIASATTGTYDPTLGIAKYLQVRDPSTFAATKINGSSLYDWGAFGLMSRIWSARRGGLFNVARDAAIKIQQRHRDGLPRDGEWFDIGFWRGRQGLSYQTAFVEAIEHGSGPTS
jgi:hypothetical protein